MLRSNHGSFRHLTAALLVAAALAACTPATAPNPFRAGDVAPAFDPSDISPNEITREEILSRGRNQATAMSLIRRLRPTWLSVRGQNSFASGANSYPIVYIDEVRHGGLPTLHGIPTSQILRLEFYNTADATTRWGTGHTAGVINVVTGRF